MSETETSAGQGSTHATMTVTVDNDVCQGHARCWHVAPEFFTLDDEGYSNICQDKPVPASAEAHVTAGVEACPEMALTIKRSGK